MYVRARSILCACFLGSFAHFRMEFYAVFTQTHTHNSSCLASFSLCLLLIRSLALFFSSVQKVLRYEIVMRVWNRPFICVYFQLLLVALSLSLTLYAKLCVLYVCVPCYLVM